ncbi:MAG: ribonuclease H-like domain-containing protein [Solirubrobacterales bacterium]
MGRSRAAAFKKIGIGSFEDLDTCNIGDVVADLRALGHHTSPTQLEQLRLHIQSYREGRAIMFGPPPPVGDSYVALDLEYDLFNPRLWLIGLYLVDGGRREQVALWAEDYSSERANLERMFELLDERADLPIVTWGGISADFPQLRSACKRLGVDGMLGIEDRHIDFFASIRKILRLPLPDFGLAEVAAFFGVAKRSSIGDGREAMMLFARYLSTYSASKRRELKDELIAYNLDDLEALVETQRAIQKLPIENVGVAAPQSLPSLACTPSSQFFM